MTVEIPMTDEERRRFEAFVEGKGVRPGWYVHDVLIEEIEEWERRTGDIVSDKTQINPDLVERRGLRGLQEREETG